MLRSGWSCAVALLAVTAPAGGADPVPLVWHVETLAGKVVDSHEADLPINPASVVKVATTLWALERLGPAHRFDTRFLAVGEIEGGTLRGDLFVAGGGDPDFHPENAFLAGLELNRAGIRRVDGRLVVGERFWIGWEGGAEKTVSAPRPRAERMATRLRQALDRRRWTREIQLAWREFARRRGLDPAQPPQVEVAGGISAGEAPPEARVMAVHRSKPLSAALRRFNCYSNNDIERIGEVLGEPSDLAALLVARLGAEAAAVDLATTSGLGRNRLTPRLVVRLLQALRETCDAVGVEPEALLPVAGCDPGTLETSFPSLSQGARATAVVGKTGTLLQTDGGVAVLAGFAKVRGEELAFCVAAPGSGRRLERARSQEDAWTAALIDRNGGPHPRTCGPALPMPDQGAEILADPGVP